MVTIWQSRAHQERWAAEQLFPAFQEFGMAEDVLANREFTAYETGELYVARSATSRSTRCGSDPAGRSTATTTTWD